MVQYRPQKRARVQEQHSVSTLGKPGCPADFEGPFRSNIRSFLHDFARGPVSAAPALSLPGVRAWTLPLRCESGTPLSLYILEETPLLSPILHCDRCRVLGWGHHPVCQRRYHFIIGSIELEESTGVGKGRKLCLGCSRVIPASTKTCPGCGSDATKTKVLEARTHLLHGVIHGNGYGHLLRVNGREGGSHSLSGREIMDLWDRLCTMLRAREVSVMDVSKKYNLEFRLLHTVAYGYCWYGVWDYSFGRGSFNISKEMYTRSLKTISCEPLKAFTNCQNTKLPDIVRLYKSLSKPSAVTTLGELIRVMMELVGKLRREAFAVKNKRDGGNVGEKVAISHHNLKDTGVCRWPSKRLEQAQDALLNILRASEKPTWLSRQILRENARSHIGDTGLLDFVLKGFVNKTVEREIVRRRVNARTRMLEYRLEDLDEQKVDDLHGGLNGELSGAVIGDHPQYKDVCQHLAFVYQAVLETMPVPSQILLDVKQNIKNYEGELTRDQCQLGFTQSVHGPGDEPYRVLCYLDLQENEGRRRIPPELVVLPRNATIGDLKQSAEKAFRDVYLSFERFQVLRISELDGAEDYQKLSARFSNIRCHLTFQVTGIDESSPGRREAGAEEWVVRCHCGTEDDDGERMAECGLCKIWQHTRCVGIQDSEPVPQNFICDCCYSFHPPTGSGV